MPKYTNEQVERAKNVDVRKFLEDTENYIFDNSHARYVKCHNPQRTGQPSSLSIDTKLNRIFYNSITGNRPLSAVDWCMTIKNMDFQSSMQLILGENPQGERAERPKYQQYRAKPVTNTIKNLELSERSDNSNNVIDYLTKTRGIPANIVYDCLNKNLIYQDIRKNAVFVGYDSDNKIPKYAARRGTFTADGKEPFKRDCTGSDKNFSFRLEGKSTETVYVAEAAIDTLSLAALEDKFNGSGAYKEKTYLSTGGAGIDGAIEQFCKTHNVKTINVCFDNDEAGKNGMEKIMQKFREQGYEVNDMRASLAHDYNDELLAFNQNADFYAEPPITVRQVNKTDLTVENEQISQEKLIKPPLINEADIYYGFSQLSDNVIMTERKQLDTPNGFILGTSGKGKAFKIIPETKQEERIDIMPEINIGMYGEHYEPTDEEIAAIYSGHYEPTPEEVAASYGNSEQQMPQQPQEENPPVQPIRPQEEKLSVDKQPVITKSKQSAAVHRNEKEQKNQQPEQETAKPSVIFGNTGYSKISDKEHIANIDPSISVSLFNRLQQENIQFSGKFTDNGLLVAVSKDKSDKVNAIIREETALHRKKDEQEINAAAAQDIPKEEKKKLEQTAVPEENKTEKTDFISEKEISSMSSEQKLNFLLASMKDRQENKRAELLDKIDGIQEKISAREAKIDKLNSKIADIETSLKTSAAFKRAFGNTALGSLIDKSIERKQAKIQKIKDVSIPKQQEKLKKQNGKKEKAVIRLGRVNKKIDRIDKVHNFFTALGSKDQHERLSGFVNGLENLSDIRRESLENKAQKIDKQISQLTEKYNFSDITHRERLEIGKEINSLRMKSKTITEKIHSMDKLHQDLTDIKNGKFTAEELDKTVEKTADKISERLESTERTDNKGVLSNVIEQSVEAGNKAIEEIAAEKAIWKGIDVKMDEKKQERAEKYFEQNENLVLSVTSVPLDWNESHELYQNLFDTDSEKYGKAGILSEAQTAAFAMRIKKGEDISRDFAIALIGNNPKNEIEFEVPEYKINVYDPDNYFTQTINVKYGENSLTASYGNMSREVSYEEIGQKLIDHIKDTNNFIEVVANEQKLEHEESDILAKAAVITGVDISEINRLPAEIKADIVAEFQENHGNISTEQLAERICEIAYIEPPETIKSTEPEVRQQENSMEKEKSEKQALYSIEHADEHRYYKAGDLTVDEIMQTAQDNMPFAKLKSMGEQISGEEFAEIQQSASFTYSVDLNFDNNSASIYQVNDGKGGISENDRNDGNMKIDTVKISDYDKEQKQEVKKDEPLFSRSKVMSDDFKPTSSKSQEDINHNKKHNMEI